MCDSPRRNGNSSGRNTPTTQQDVDEEVKRRREIQLNLRREESLKRKKAAEAQKERRAREQQEFEERQRLAEIEKQNALERRERECREERKRERDMRRRVKDGECTMEQLLEEMTAGRELTMIEKEEKLAELQACLWADFE